MEHFKKLNSVNVNEHTDKKGKLTYLSWAWAWAETKKVFPDATYKIEKFNGLPYVYDPLTGYMVYTSVTIENHTHEMWLFVMDGANKAMKAQPYSYLGNEWINGTKKAVEKTVEAATMFDINTTLMRCLTKNLAMFGLGLYIYAGEDIPEGEINDLPKKEPSKTAENKGFEHEPTKEPIWLNADQFEKAIKSDAKGITATLNAYSQKGYAMKGEYRTKLTEKLGELTK